MHCYQETAETCYVRQVQRSKVPRLAWTVSNLAYSKHTFYLLLLQSYCSFICKRSKKKRQRKTSVNEIKASQLCDWTISHRPGNTNSDSKSAISSNRAHNTSIHITKQPAVSSATNAQVSAHTTRISAAKR